DELDPDAHPYCDPLWSVGNGPDADRLEVKVRNAYAYARENKPGAGTAEMHFAGDVGYTVASMKAFAESWDGMIEAQRPAREAARDRIRQERAKQEFADDVSRPETADELKARQQRTEERRRRKEQSAVPETLDSLLSGWCYVGQQKRFVRKRD